MNKLTHDQIAELVVEAQSGNQQAFAKLYEATVDRQLYFATAFLKDPILAEDVVQDVYIKMFKAIDNLKIPRTFVAYLNRICYNSCVDYKKKYFPQKYELEDELINYAEDTDVNYQPQQQAELAETSSELQLALSKLSDNQRTAFMFRHYDDMKIKEIAKAMDISESSVKRYVKSANKTLKSLLSNNERGALFDE